MVEGGGAGLWLGARWIVRPRRTIHQWTALTAPLHGTPTPLRCSFDDPEVDHVCQLVSESQDSTGCLGRLDSQGGVLGVDVVGCSTVDEVAGGAVGCPGARSCCSPGLPSPQRRSAPIRRPPSTMSATSVQRVASAADRAPTHWVPKRRGRSTNR